METEGSDWEVEARKEGEVQLETPEEDNTEMQSYSVRIVSSPEKMKEDLAAFKKYREWLRQSKGKEKAVQEEVPVAVESNSENDSDYKPGDDESSEGDEEAAHIRNELKELKKKFKVGCLVLVDGEGQQVNVEGLTASNAPTTEISDDGTDTPYFDTDEEEDSYDGGPDGEVHRKKKIYPTFDSNANVPSFIVGMSFSDKQDFRQAVIKHGLVEWKVIKFVKNEANKCRAVCTWPKCPWVLHLSKTTRAESWHLATCKGVHTCPPRRDNSLVTARRIADKYEKFIKANPQ